MAKQKKSFKKEGLMAGFFQDEKGDKSMGRLVFFIGTIFNILVTSYILRHFKDFGTTLTQVAIFSGGIQAVFSGHNIWSKNMEISTTTDTPTSNSDPVSNPQPTIVSNINPNPQPNPDPQPNNAGVPDGEVP